MANTIKHKRSPRKRVALNIMVTRLERDQLNILATQRGVSLSEFCYKHIMLSIAQKVTVHSAERYLDMLAKRPQTEFDPDAQD